MDFLLTEPSQVSEVGPREGEQQAALHLCGSRGDCSRVSASQPETGTHCGAKQQKSPIPGRQPQHDTARCDFLPGRSIPITIRTCSRCLRDIERTCRYFAYYGINNNPWELARQIWTNHMGPVPELV